MIAIDFVIRFWHGVNHDVPVMWRAHHMHHADRDYNLTTWSCFHTIEIASFMLMKVATITLLGPPTEVAVVTF